MSDIRPDLPLDQIDALVERYRHSYFRRFQGTPEEYRVLHHLERYWFVRDYINQYEMHEDDGHLIGTHYSNINLGGDNPSLSIEPQKSHPEPDFLSPAPYGGFLIDCGCGEGLGLRELLKTKFNIIYAAVESDPTVYAKLCEDFGKGWSLYNDNIETVQPTRPSCFNFVVCFEVLGFASLSSDETLLMKLDGLCGQDGVLFISTPNYRGRPKKEYFSRTYDMASFTELLHKSLPGYGIGIYGQMYPTNRRDYRDDGVLPLERLPGDPDFLIAVAKKRS